jgi:hypothetical protein
MAMVLTIELCEQYYAMWQKYCPKACCRLESRLRNQQPFIILCGPIKRDSLYCVQPRMKISINDCISFLSKCDAEGKILINLNEYNFSTCLYLFIEIISVEELFDLSVST